MAKFILKLAENPPENQYHFAFDNCKDRRQKAFIESISKYVGTGECVAVESIEQTLLDRQWEDALRLDLDMIPSLLLVNEESPPDFEWHCEVIDYYEI